MTPISNEMLERLVVVENGRPKPFYPLSSKEADNYYREFQKIIEAKNSYKDKATALRICGENLFKDILDHLEPCISFHFKDASGDLRIEDIKSQWQRIELLFKYCYPNEEMLKACTTINRRLNDLMHPNDKSFLEKDTKDVLKTWSKVVFVMSGQPLSPAIWRFIYFPKLHKSLRKPLHMIFLMQLSGEQVNTLEQGSGMLKEVTTSVEYVYRKKKLSGITFSIVTYDPSFQYHPASNSTSVLQGFIRVPTKPLPEILDMIEDWAQADKIYNQETVLVWTAFTLPLPDDDPQTVTIMHRLFNEKTAKFCAIPLTGIAENRFQLLNPKLKTFRTKPELFINAMYSIWDKINDDYGE